VLRNQVSVHILLYSPTSTLILTFRQPHMEIRIVSGSIDGGYYGSRREAQMTALAEPVDVVRLPRLSPRREPVDITRTGRALLWEHRIHSTCDRRWNIITSTVNTVEQGANAL